MNKYYDILGIKNGASTEEIRQAYRDLVKVWHPDRFINDQRLQKMANEKLKEIIDAYEKLKGINLRYRDNKESGHSNNCSSPECQTQETEEDFYEHEASWVREPRKGDLVCGNCGYIVDDATPPKHTFWGGLICPLCKNKGFYVA